MDIEDMVRGSLIYYVVELAYIFASTYIILYTYSKTNNYYFEHERTIEKMATITGSSSASLVARASLVQNTRVGVSSSPIRGLPVKTVKKGKLTCSMEEKSSTQENNLNKGMGPSWLAAVAAATTSGPAMGLVDERMSTEGTGLPFGLSNNLLGWILLGVFALIWALYFVYTSSLEEDEDSGLSL